MMSFADEECKVLTVLSSQIDQAEKYSCIAAAGISVLSIFKLRQVARNDDISKR